MTEDVEGVDAVVQHVRPNSVEVIVGEPSVALRGFSKFTWLNVLKVSRRNCNRTRSVMAKFLSAPKSKFQYDGPWKMLRPWLPFWPGGGMQNWPPLAGFRQAGCGSEAS